MRSRRMSSRASRHDWRGRADAIVHRLHDLSGDRHRHLLGRACTEPKPDRRADACELLVRDAVVLEHSGLTAGQELQRTAVELASGGSVAGDEPSLARARAGERGHDGDRALVAYGLGKRDDELRVEWLDEDLNRTAARQADLE